MPLGAVHPIWFSEAAVAAWRAEPRTTPGGQPHHSALAIATALTLRTVFRLALRQTEGLIGSVLHLLGVELAVPDHNTLSHWAETLEAPRPASGSSAAPVHLLVDGTGSSSAAPVRGWSRGTARGRGAGGSSSISPRTPTPV